MNRMRTIGVLMLVTLFLTQEIKSQDLEITPMMGYAVRNELRFKEGKMELRDLLNIGANFSFPTANYRSKFEITLSNSFTHARWKESPDYADLVKEMDYTMMITYFHIAWVVEGEIQRGFNIYFGPNMGLVNYNISKSEVENMPRFSIGAQTGMKFYFDRMLGIRIQALCALPVFMGSGKHFRGITEYPGQESYLTVDATTFPVNLIISAGLMFRIWTR